MVDRVVDRRLSRLAADGELNSVVREMYHTDNEAPSIHQEDQLSFLCGPAQAANSAVIDQCLMGKNFRRWRAYALPEQLRIALRTASLH